MAVYKVVTGIKVAEDDGMAGNVRAAVRLIDAGNKAQAIAHVVRDTITCEVVEVGEAVQLGAAGVKVEQAA